MNMIIVKIILIRKYKMITNKDYIKMRKFIWNDTKYNNMACNSAEHLREC
jgi:hypothetical protein